MKNEIVFINDESDPYIMSKPKMYYKIRWDSVSCWFEDNQYIKVKYLDGSEGFNINKKNYKIERKNKHGRNKK